MGYYDIEAKKKKDITDSVYAASENLLTDLVNVYDRLREVELAVLGAYKTTGWNATYGSPVAKGYPHMRVVHSVLGDTYLREAVDHLRSNGGAAAFPWDTVPSKAQMQTAGHPLKGLSMRHILELYQAIGRAVASPKLRVRKYNILDDGSLSLVSTSYLYAGDTVDCAAIDEDVEIQGGMHRVVNYIGGQYVYYTYYDDPTPEWDTYGGHNDSYEVCIFNVPDDEDLPAADALETAHSSIITTIDPVDTDSGDPLGGLSSDPDTITNYHLSDPTPRAGSYVSGWVNAAPYIPYTDIGTGDVGVGPVQGTTAGLDTSWAWKTSDSDPTSQTDLLNGDTGNDKTYFWVWPTGKTKLRPFQGNNPTDYELAYVQDRATLMGLGNPDDGERTDSVGIHMRQDSAVTSSMTVQSYSYEGGAWLHWDRPMTKAELIAAGWPVDTDFGANL